MLAVCLGPKGGFTKEELRSACHSLVAPIAYLSSPYAVEDEDVMRNDTVDNSVNYIEEAVTSLYRAMLKRDPDPHYLKIHMEQVHKSGIRDGLTNIVDHFLSTDEFWRRVAPLHIAYEVRRRKLTYLDIKTIASLQSCISTIQELQVPGDFVEFGVALGGSGICLAQGLDEHRRYFGFDVFGMIPPPSEFDGKCVHDRYETIAAGNSIGIDGTKYYGYIDNLLEVVKRNFASMGYAVDDTRINLVKGLFSDTLPSYGSLTIALAHIDCDWYDSVKLSLSYVWPRLSVGGLIILDDYNAWDGCAKATHEFLGSCKGAKLICRAPHAIIRKAA